MDSKALTPKKANCIDAWPAQTDNIMEWFENDMQKGSLRQAFIH
jgi:hypothetical protein